MLTPGAQLLTFSPTPTPHYGAGHLVTATFGQPPIWPRKKKKHQHFIGQEIQLSISELKILISIFIMTPQKNWLGLQMEGDELFQSLQS